MQEREDSAAVQLVTHGTIEVEGRLLDASNVTLFCTIELDGESANAVYKPVEGERPLWDFAEGSLAGREVASYLIASTTGMGVIPPTAYREGPLGAGMVQLWIDTTEESLVDVVRPDEVPGGWLPVLHAHDRTGDPVVLAHSDREDVRDLALLDVIINNADRKGGHVVTGADGCAYGLDHGICLHTEPKLRTVLWGWSGTRLTDDDVEKLRKLRVDLDGKLGQTLSTYLTQPEIDAVSERARTLVERGEFPAPVENIRAIPWPLF